MIAILILFGGAMVLTWSAEIVGLAFRRWAVAFPMLALALVLTCFGFWRMAVVF